MAESVPPPGQDVAQTVAAEQSAAIDSPAGGRQHEGMISELTVDESMRDVDDDTSTIASDAASTSTSASLATEYRYEHGRRYHAFTDGKYHLPNDEREMDRLELQHLIYSASFNGVHSLCPLPENMTDALDVGCGTGSWTIEFAHAHPQTNVLGTDLSPIQPSTVPINCTFIIDDATQEWSFHQRFDYIHTRALGMGIPDWPKFIRQTWTFLKPGGWLELQEFHLGITSDDGTLKDGSALWTWREEILAAMKNVGLDGMNALQHPRMMREQGFQNIGEKLLKIPLGPWARGKREKRIGAMAQKDLIDGLEGASTKLLLMKGYKQEQIDELLENTKKDLMDPAIHSYITIVVAWGQKPS